MKLELLYLPGCPNHVTALEMVRNVLEQEGWRVQFTETPISDYEQAKRHRFPGSPTIRVNGRDIEQLASNHFAVGFACRTYRVDGAQQAIPPRAWLERALRDAQISEEVSK